MKTRTLLFPLATAFAIACGAGQFDPQNVVNTVRILATRADKPYAAPGDKVTLAMLAFDGRPVKPHPMGIFWIPLPCINPKNDAYYNCFAALSGKGGKPGSGNPALQPGVDLTPVLPSGPTFSVTVPSDIIASHPRVPGAADPYGLVIVFNMACAGHVEIIAPDPNDANPQSIPVGCFDASHNRLGANDFVFGFTRVYAYATRTNENPLIDHVELDGVAVDPQAGITLDHCGLDTATSCPEHKLLVVAPDSDQQVNPGDVDTQGNTRREQIWATLYASGGQFGNDATLLFDPRVGRVDGNDVKYFAPKDAGDAFVWVVIHDNRDGASWLQIPVHAR